MGLGTSYNIACNIAHFDQYDHTLQPIYVCSTVFSWSAVKDANVRSVCCFSRSLCRSTSAIMYAMLREAVADVDTLCNIFFALNCMQCCVMLRALTIS